MPASFYQLIYANNRLSGVFAIFSHYYSVRHNSSIALGLSQHLFMVKNAYFSPPDKHATKKRKWG